MNYGANHKAPCFTFQSLVTHIVCVTHWSENLLYITSVSNTHRICIYDIFHLEILPLFFFVLAAKIHRYTLEVTTLSSSDRLASVPEKTTPKASWWKDSGWSEGLRREKVDQYIWCNPASHYYVYSLRLVLRFPSEMTVSEESASRGVFPLPEMKR